MHLTAKIAGVRIVRRDWIVWAIWAGFSLAASAVIVLGPQRHPVNESYAQGAQRWEARARLYDEDGCGFIYAPQSAILHWPFARLPRPLYELAWRLVNLGLLAAGMQRLAYCCEGKPRAGRLATAKPPPSLFLVMTLLTLPKTWTLALNGQAAMAMAGLLLLAVVDVAERHWWRAAAALLLALAFKPLAIVLLLLVAGLFPPMLWRLSAGGLLFLAFPYFTQDPAYVNSQYSAFFRNLFTAAALGRQMVWPGLFSLLHMFGLGVSVYGQTIAQIAAALMTLSVGGLVRRRFPALQAGALLYALAMCYLLLFNPRTENNSYSLLMPAVAGFAARALVVDKCWSRSVLFVGLAAALTGGFAITRAVTPRAEIVWICPLACLVFLGLLLAEIAKPLAWNRCDPSRRADAPLSAAGWACST